MAATDLGLTGEAAYGDELIRSALDAHPIETLPAADRPYLDLAIYYLLRDQPDEADKMLAAYEAIESELELRDPDELYLLCRGYQKLTAGNTEAALAEFRDWDRLEPRFPGADAWIGHAFYAEAELDSAIVYYDKYLAKNHPWKIYSYRYDLAGVLTNLAASYAGTNQPLRAQEVYDKFAALWKDADPELKQKVESARRNAGRQLREES